MKASRLFISVFGAFIGLMGFEHGLGEILQGPVSTPGLIFPSWPDSEFFAIQGGEPAFSIISNMLFSGILASMFSMAFVAISVFLPDHRHSRSIMVLLAGLMFLTGAGIFPPLIALIIAFSARRLSTPISSWHSAPAGFENLILPLWPWVFDLCLLCWLAMFPIIPALDYFFGLSNDAVMYAIIVGMILLLVLANLSSRAKDMLESQRSGVYP